MTVDAIKDAISELDATEKASLTAWLVEQDASEWDRQMKDDFAPGGAGMALLEEAEADVHAGRTKSMDQFLAEAKDRNKNTRP